MWKKQGVKSSDSGGEDHWNALIGQKVLHSKGAVSWRIHAFCHSSSPFILTRSQSLVRTCNRFLSPWWSIHYIPPKRRFLYEPHSVTSQKTAFFILLLRKAGVSIASTASSFLSEHCLILVLVTSLAARHSSQTHTQTKLRAKPTPIHRWIQS
jgi:hypothetical protein